ncbi:MAG: ABC transporter permease [Methanosarcina sp.]|mgnify:CR=1 FL=1|jgi:ABC-2 type transport system permease protein|nr:ABC transporter permease [Methanosarcina sp.]MDD3873835.1 ABC transporter permease [Methanosarcina sp.]MDD4522632.1 ABC transporter permease [Methanosarcina sp.]HHV23483.1 ABC transporter permease [Methanosarcina sp.]
MPLNLTAIYTIWLREMIRFFRAKSRVIASFSMPLFFLVFLGLGFNSSFKFSGLTPGIDYIDFLAPGIIGMALLFDSLSSGLSVLMDKQFGFLKEIMVAPVDRLSIVIGKTLGGTTTALIQGLIILIVASLIGFEVKEVSGLLSSLVFMVLISVSFVGIGMIFASKIDDMHGFQLITRLVAFPVFLLSGAFFPSTNLPTWLRYLHYINPLSYGVDGLRFCLIGTSQFPPIQDLFVLLGFCIFTMVSGTYFFSIVEVEG